MTIGREANYGLDDFTTEGDLYRFGQQNGGLAQRTCSPKPVP